MRWPIRNQILLRTIALLAITILAITIANIRSTISVNRQQESKQIDQLVELFRSTKFPINSPVLESMKSLSNAEFALVDARGKVIARTQSSPQSFPIKNLPGQSSGSNLAEAVELDGASYFYTMVDRVGGSQTQDSGRMHIFVPRKTNRELQWQASATPLWIALIAFPVAFLVSIALSSQVSRPLSHLRSQVQEIAIGHHSEIPITQTNDEIRDLGSSINEMSRKLKENEVELRANERLKNMVQFGSGVAHHLRNSATGCKMAVQLMAEDCPEVRAHEAYEVSMRQFDLMDRYLRKFLLLSKTSISQAETQELVELTRVLRTVESLLRPTAEHLGVSLNVEFESEPNAIRISNDDAEQVIMNLVGNAITAASSKKRKTGSPEVHVRLSGEDDGVRLRVRDNGEGPPDEIKDTIFESFVTGAKEGTGLGLALVREVAESHGGNVSWARTDEWTVFTFDFKREKN